MFHPKIAFVFPGRSITMVSWSSASLQLMKTSVTGWCLYAKPGENHLYYAEMVGVWAAGSREAVLENVHCCTACPDGRWDRDQVTSGSYLAILDWWGEWNRALSGECYGGTSTHAVVKPPQTCPHTLFSCPKALHQVFFHIISLCISLLLPCICPIPFGCICEDDVVFLILILY